MKRREKQTRKKNLKEQQNRRINREDTHKLIRTLRWNWRKSQKPRQNPRKKTDTKAEPEKEAEVIVQPKIYFPNFI